MKRVPRVSGIQGPPVGKRCGRVEENFTPGETTIGVPNVIIGRKRGENPRPTQHVSYSP